MSRKSRQTQNQNSANSLTPATSRPLVDHSPSGPEARKLVQITGQVTASSFSGPLPPPVVLREYNLVVPGSADRIVAQAERQTEHRITLETQVVRSDISRSWWGLACGFVLCLICIVGGILCVLQGHDLAGSAIATGAVVGLATAFIYGTAMRKAERTEKAKILTGQKE